MKHIPTKYNPPHEMLNFIILLKKMLEMTDKKLSHFDTTVNTLKFLSEH